MSAAAARESAQQSIVIPAELQSLRLELAPLLTGAEIAELFGVSASSVDRWVREKKFPAPFKLGGAVQRFSRDAVLAHLATAQSRAPFAARTRKAGRAKGRAAK